MRLPRPKSRHVLTAAAVLLFVLGCSSRNETKIVNVGDVTIPATKRGEPITKIIGIWQPADGRNAKGLPCRGLAGNIMFFTSSSERPVKIEGEGKVIVYVFDDQGSKEEQSRPLTRVIIDDLQALNAHFRQGAVGPSYQMFIPYPRNVAHQVKMSVAAVLKPTQGAPASSDLVTITLPGPVREEDQRPVVQNVTQTPIASGTIVTTLNQHSRKPSPDEPQHVKQKFVPRTQYGMQDPSLRQAAATQQPAQPKRDWQQEIQQVAGSMPAPRRKTTREEKIRELQRMIEELKQEQVPSNPQPGRTILEPISERSANQTEDGSTSRGFRLSPSPNAPQTKNSGGEQVAEIRRNVTKVPEIDRSKDTQEQARQTAAEILLGSPEQPVNDKPTTETKADSWSSDGPAYKPAPFPGRSTTAKPAPVAVRMAKTQTARDLLEGDEFD